MDEHPTDFVPTTRPVRRLVGAIALVGLASIAVWWSAAVGPRVSAAVQSVDADTAAGRGTLHIEVHNDGPLALDVRGVGIDDRAGASVEVGDVLIDGRPMAGGPFHLATGQSARVEISYIVDCNRPGGYGADPALGVMVHAPLGITQTRPISTEGGERFLTGRSGDFDRGPLLCPSAGPGGRD